MKRVILLTLSMLLLVTGIYGNVFVVASYKHDTKNLSARVHPRKDNNDELCGLILVNTDILNLGVVAGTGVAGPVKYKRGYYWVYLSPGTRRISFYKKGFLTLNYDLPSPVKSGETYLLTLKYRNTGNSQAGNTMGYVVIESHPEGADVYINDSATGMQTPFQNPYLEGYYRFTLKKSLFIDTTGSFEIHPGKTSRVSINLSPNFGSFTISTTPEINAKVTIDGEDKGTTPVTVKRLPPGKHTLHLNKAMYLPWQSSFTISKGKNTQRTITMKANFGTIDVNAQKEDTIYIDNRQMGTGNYTGRLLRGTHIIRVEHQHYYTQSKQVEIVPGQNMEVTFKLKPKTGTLSIMTDPIGAGIIIDSKPMGKSPKFIDSLIVGIHTVKLQKQGYAPVKKQIKITDNRTTTIKETLASGMNVRITSQPNGAKLYVDGKYKGLTPVTIPLSFGNHQFKLQKNHYKDYVETKAITIGNNHLDFQLEQFFNLNISFKPKNATVYIDGTAMSNSSNKYSLSQGEHKITVEANGFITHSKTILVNGKLKTRFIKLRPAYLFGIGYTFGLNTKGVDVTSMLKRIELSIEAGKIDYLPNYLHYSSYTATESAYELGFRFYYPIDFSIHGGYGIRSFQNKGINQRTNPDQSFYSGIVGITLPIKLYGVMSFYLKSDYWTNTENGGAFLFTTGLMF